jgi:hypothetical protein
MIEQDEIGILIKEVLAIDRLHPKPRMPYNVMIGKILSWKRSRVAFGQWGEWCTANRIGQTRALRAIREYEKWEDRQPVQKKI